MANSDSLQGTTNYPGIILIVNRVNGEGEHYESLLQLAGMTAGVVSESYDGPILEHCQTQVVEGILVECYAPDRRGLELIRHINTQLGDQCPPLIAIDSNDAYLAMAAIKAGATDYLVRGQFTADQLRQALRPAPEAADQPSEPEYYEQEHYKRDRFLAVGSDLEAIAGRDGYFHWVSPTFERILGWTPAEMTARPWVEFLHPDDIQLSVIEAERLLAGREVLAFENRYRHKDGTYRWLLWRCQWDIDQQVSYGTAVDISALKQSEVALNESHHLLEEQSHRFEAMLSTISDFVYLFDREGRFVFANQPLLDLWGLTLADVVGKNFYDLHYPEMLAAKHQAEIERVFATAEIVKDETAYTSPTGVGGIYEYIFMPLIEPAGVVQAVVGSTRNITDRKRDEAALQASEERFRLTANTVPEIIWITDHRGQVEFVNQQWSAYTGAAYEPTTAVEALVSFVHPDDVPLTLDAFNQALQTGELFRVEHRLRSAAGFYRWFLVQAEPYRDPQGGEIRRWFGTLVDIHDLKLAEAALRTSEAKYRSLFNSMDEGFCILEVIFDEQQQAIDYRYVEINPAFEHQTGLSNALGKSVRELVPNIEPFWFDTYGQVALTGEPTRFEDYAESMGRWFDVNAFRIGKPYERRVAVLFNDITETKQTAEQLHRSAQLDAFRVTLFDALRVLSDPISVQATACRLLGEALNASQVYYYEYNEDAGSGIVQDTYQQAGENSLVGAYQFADFPATHTLLNTGQLLVLPDIANAAVLPSQERARLHQLGLAALASVPLVKRRRLVAVFNVGQSSPRDWTPLEIAFIQETAERTWAAVARARAETRLSNSEAQFRLLVTTSSDTLYKMSADWSKRCTLDGQDFLAVPDQSQRTWLEQWVPADDQPQVMAAIDHAIRAKCSFELEHRIKRTDGTVGWTLSRAVPLLNEYNEIVEWFGAASDVTERKQLLEREQAARQQAERANRTKDEFLAILSHELRSPLNPILGWAKLLQTKTLDEAKTNRALATIERNAKLQAELIDDLLDVAKILRGKLEISDRSINLASVIEAAIDVVRTAIQAKAIRLKTTLNEDCLVRGDSVRLQQIIWNLLSNAVKFTPQGGQIDIQLEPVDYCAQITITDTGKGISPGFLPQLFDSFRQEDVSITRQYGGLGLGLSIVKYLVEAHGGNIVASSPGEGLGATFTLQLPLMEDSAQGPLVAPNAPRTIDLSGIKVLTVDDSPDTRDLLVTLLEQYGAEVRAEAGASAALPQLTRWRPDVLVCDIGMPDMDGYTLIQQIRRLPTEQGGQIPAIAVTAYARADDQQRALDYGFQKHLSKPIEPDQLLRAVADLA
ncbi:PAS domain S-box protein [Nodosilinea sp. E11]|uniref:PAS domain S-box protein n=1 Tax=Nodosilinea sp. E11 TaxID=3037479 RepID=UPI002934CD6F|nr:PAS domain S-box protein [Nodosilinea sp. E11]WOD40071.1 PAS domain S-box protein [Nodosilinea sp. E11]